jgi:hypothetical protein
MVVKFSCFRHKKNPKHQQLGSGITNQLKGLNRIVRVYSLVSSFISWLIFLSGILNSLIPLPKPFINSGIFLPQKQQYHC